jgi:hypothetical protein
MTPARGKALQRFEANRVCGHPACETVLSRYNAESTCSVHSGIASGRILR